MTLGLALLCYGASAAAPSPPPTYGWIAQKNPASRYNNANDYDWGKLTANYLDTFSGNFSYTINLGDDYANYWEDQFDFFTYPDGVTVDITGTSKFRWLWTPPTDSTWGLVFNDPNRGPKDPGQPFQTPPLLVIGWHAPHIAATGDNPNTVANAYVTDGFGDNWKPTMSGLPLEVPLGSEDLNTGLYYNDLPRIQVIYTTLEPDNATADATLSPSLHLQFDPGGPNDDGAAEWDLLGSVYPINLVYPKPFARPDLGDGKNQFLYDPTGVLSIPVGIAAFAAPGTTPPSQNGIAEANWLLKPNFGGPLRNSGPIVQVSIVNPNNQALQPQDSTLIVDNLGDIIPKTRDSNGIYSYLYGGPGFGGLPNSPAGFGNFYALVSVNYLTPVGRLGKYTYTSTYLQTFWHGLDGTHPVQQTDPPAAGAWPNWFYYYSQIFNPIQQINPNTGMVNNYSVTFSNNAPNSNSSPISSTSTTADTIVINHDAYGTQPIPVFDIDASPTADMITNTNLFLLRNVGTLTVSGVFNFIHVVGHEQGHVISFTTNLTITAPSGLQFTGPVYTEFKAGNIFPASFGDTSDDGDNLWDAWEYYHHMSPYTANTAGVADNEAVAEINALNCVFSYINSWKLDWDDQGLNWTIPYFAKTRMFTKPSDLPNTPPVFYLNFVALKPGRTFKVGNTYPIRTLADLQAEYPSVLTQLPPAYIPQ